MERSSRRELLVAGLDLLGRVGFKGWSMRGVEDEAGVPHGTARHHFANQRGLVLEMVRYLLAADRPSGGESIEQQVARWIGIQSGWTRARYELMIVSFHDPELAVELVAARDQLVEVLGERGIERREAVELAGALDGLVLDAVLRRTAPEDVDVSGLLARFGGAGAR